MSSFEQKYGTSRSIQVVYHFLVDIMHTNISDITIILVYNQLDLSISNTCAI